MSQFFASGGQSIGVSASALVLPMNIQDDVLQDGLAGSPCSPRDSQESSPTPQFKSISSSALSFLYSPTLTSIHDNWKNHSFDDLTLTSLSPGAKPRLGRDSCHGFSQLPGLPQLIISVHSQTVASSILYTSPFPGTQLALNEFFQASDCKNTWVEIVYEGRMLLISCLQLCNFKYMGILLKL